jgi:hypothetical protein
MSFEAKTKLLRPSQSLFMSALYNRKIPCQGISQEYSATS